jgi:radical SAM superfamily enzyme YgiQ (UPF0313 family)
MSRKAQPACRWAKEEAMKILLISTNHEQFPVPVPPAGAAQIAGAMRYHGHHVRLLDLCFEQDAASSVAIAIRSFVPDLIGISFRNLDNASTFGTKSYLSDLRELVSAIRATSSAEIIIGGSGFSCAPEAILRHLDIEYGVAGDGERAMLRFTEAISRRTDPTDIPGLVYLRDGQVHRNPPDAHTHLDDLPPPAWDLLDGRRYLANGGCAAVQTKRGCAFRCIYCSYPVIEGSRYRLQSPRSVVDGIEKLNKEQGVTSFFFVDSVFSYPEEHATGICKEICRRKLRIRWEAMTNPRGATQELVQAMKESGCIGIEFGIDTASAEMLLSLRKGFTQSDIAKAASLYAEVNIPTSVYLLIGGPGETEKTVAETVTFLDGAGDFAQVMMNFGIRIYEGTELADISRHEGLIGAGEDLMEPRFYASAGLPSGFLGMLDEYCRTRPSWSDATDWNSKTGKIMLKLATLCGMRPFWKHSFLMGMARNVACRGGFGRKGPPLEIRHQDRVPHTKETP